MRRFVPFIIILIVLGVAIGADNKADEQTRKNNAHNRAVVKGFTISTNTETPRKTSVQETKKPTHISTSTPKPVSYIPLTTEEPNLEIVLKYPNLGEYGRYYTFNENVAQATAEDKNTVIQCFVPAGRYIVKSLGKYPAFVFIYSKETQLNSFGWEEPVESWQSNMLQPGDTCEITVQEGYYIKLLQNNVFSLIQVEKF